MIFPLSLMIIAKLTWINGLDISLEREHYSEGKDLFCGKLHCVENTKEDNEISALVNMSVYRTSELEGKIMLASVSESDSRVRDYKVTGSKVDGKFSKVFGELTVSFTKTSDCFSTVFGCDVYYTNKRGLIEMKENKTKPFDQDNRKPLMLMTLEAKTPEFDKTIDRMSEFLKTFKYSDKLNSADLKMNLQFSTDDRYSNQTVSQIYHRRELPVEERVDNLVNLTNAMESRLNNLLVAQESKLQKLENKINNITNGYKDVENKLGIQNKTHQELAQFKNNFNGNLLKTFQQMEANNKTLEIYNRSIKDVHSLYNVLNKQLEKLNYSVINVSLSLSQNSNQKEQLTKNIHDLKRDLITLTKENIKNSTAILEQRQNVRIQQLEESNKLLSETQTKTLKVIKNSLSQLNNTYIDLNANTEKTITSIQNLIKKSDQISVIVNRFGGLEHLKCASMNDRVAADMREAGLDVSRTLCDTKTDGGGWIIIQRRIKGDVNFTRTWNDYKNGFGSTSGDFWIGNDVISKLTDLGYNELRFDIKVEGKVYYAVYRGFKVENEAAKYKMSLTSFSGGNVTDWFSVHNGMKFTTMDSDNDGWSGGNCAVAKSGGWWYHACHNVNVNGEWASSVYKKGIHWFSITLHYSSLDFVEMKLRGM